MQTELNSSILSGLSPEEILAKKEMEGGIQYDDPDQEKDVVSPEINPDVVHSQKVSNPTISEHIQSPMMDAKPPIEKDLLNSSLRREEEPNLSTQPSKNHQFNPGLDFGWKNLPMKVLPSRGLFYPEGTKIAIRSAEVKEIRHFSSIDEDDLIDLNEKLNFIISKCATIHFPNEGIVSFKDLKHEDRFFIIMAIRDLTFVQGENRIILTPETKCKDKNSCPVSNGIELRTGVLSSYEIDPEIFKYYSHEGRNFVFQSRKMDKTITLNVPSLGVWDEISKFVESSEEKGIQIDESFLKIAPFLFSDWRDLDEKKILMKMRESDDWTKEEFSLYFELTQRIKIGTNLDVRVSCPTCGAEVAAPITFPKGFKSLFIISDIFRELL